MHNAKNKDLVALHEVHDPVSPENNFSKVLTIELGNDPSDEGSSKNVPQINNGRRHRTATEYGRNLQSPDRAGVKTSDLRHLAIFLQL